MHDLLLIYFADWTMPVQKSYVESFTLVVNKMYGLMVWWHSSSSLVNVRLLQHRMHRAEWLRAARPGRTWTTDVGEEKRRRGPSQMVVVLWKMRPRSYVRVSRLQSPIGQLSRSSCNIASWLEHQVGVESNRHGVQTPHRLLSRCRDRAESKLLREDR